MLGHDEYGWVVEEWTREAVEGVPIRPLRSVISRYRGYHRVGPSGVHRGLPSSALTFVISLADPVDVRGLPEAGRNPGAIQAFVAVFTLDRPRSITTACNSASRWTSRRSERAACSGCPLGN